MQLLKGKGHENRGMAADIPKKYAFQDAIIDKRRGMKIEEWLQASLKTKPCRMHLLIRMEKDENKGMAADLPKNKPFKDAVIDKRRGMNIEECLQKNKPLKMQL